MSSASLGLGSNRSSCDGAPSMNRKMQRLARGAKWGPRVCAVLGESAAISERSATQAEAAGGEARQKLAASGGDADRSTGLFPSDEFVEVQDDIGGGDEGGGLRVESALGSRPAAIALASSGWVSYQRAVASQCFDEPA